jgi:hypothetical protein
MQQDIRIPNAKVCKGLQQAANDERRASKSTATLTSCRNSFGCFSFAQIARRAPAP